jgi:hypothetical protein
VIGAAEQVVMLENEVKALGLQRQMERRLDWFREREARRRAEEEKREREDRTESCLNGAEALPQNHRAAALRAKPERRRGIAFCF